MQADLEKQMANKELEIEKLNSKIRENELNRQAAINEAVQKQAEKYLLYVFYRPAKPLIFAVKNGIIKT